MEWSLWAMGFPDFGSRFNSLRKTASCSHSFVFFRSGKGGGTLGYEFSRLWIEIQFVRKNGLLEQFFCLLRLWQWGATLGYEFSRFWIEIQFVGKNGLLEPFFCLLRLWQGWTILGYEFSQFLIPFVLNFLGIHAYTCIGWTRKKKRFVEGVANFIVAGTGGTLKFATPSTNRFFF